MNNMNVGKSILSGAISGLQSGGGITGSIIGGVKGVASNIKQGKDLKKNLAKADEIYFKKQDSLAKKKENDAWTKKYQDYVSERKQLGDAYGDGTPKILNRKDFIEREKRRALPYDEQKKINLEAGRAKHMANLQKIAKQKQQMANLEKMFGQDVMNSKAAKDEYYRNMLKRNEGKRKFNRKDLDNPDSPIYKTLMARFNKNKK